MCMVCHKRAYALTASKHCLFIHLVPRLFMCLKGILNTFYKK